MLMQYFSYEELKGIKKQVMAEHRRQQQWECAAEVLKGLSLWSQAEELHKAFKYADHEKTHGGPSRQGHGPLTYSHIPQTPPHPSDTQPHPFNHTPQISSWPL